MVQGLVSILMPVYNGAAFLNRSINSVLNQSYENWELIIVDDKSSDHSVSVVKAYLSDSRIFLFQNEKNKGIAASRNRAIDASKGKFIAILDQDDEWKSHKLEKQINLFNQLDSEHGLVYCNTEIHHSTGEIFTKKHDINPGKTIVENLEKLFVSNFISSLTVLFKRECIKKIGTFDESIKWGGDDYDLWLRIAFQYKFGFIDESLAIRHEHGKNFSFSKKKMMEGSLDLGKKFAKKNPQLKPLVKPRKSRHFYRFGIENLKAKNFATGLIYILKALVTSKAGLNELKKTIGKRVFVIIT